MLKLAKLKKEFILAVPNAIGALAEISKIISVHGINIEAFTGYGMGSEARVHLVTGDNQRAQDALKKAGYTLAEERGVVVVELENTPGALKFLVEKIAQEKVDITYAYGTTCTSGCPATVVLQTSNNESLLVALKKRSLVDAV